MRTLLSLALVIGVAVLIASWLAVESRAQAPDKGVLSGIWIRNAELSDPPPARGDRGERERGDRGDEAGRAGRGGRGGGMGRPGFGGGDGFGRGGGRAGGDPESMARVRDAMRDIMRPPDRLTMVQTDSMIAMTGPDGRTTRLSPDGSRVKDENTKIERRTRWESGRLISEISGAGPRRITQTISVDRERRQLRIVVEVEGDRGGQTHTLANVYDEDVR